MTISEIRSLAKAKLSGTAVKCSIACLFYFFISLLFSYLLKFLNLKIPNIVNIIVHCLFFIVSIPFGFGITSNIIKLTDSKTNSTIEFLDDFILNCIDYTKLIFHACIKLILPIILCILSIFYLIGTLTAYVNHKSFLCFHQGALPLAITLFITNAIILIYFILNYAIISFLYYNAEKKDDSKQILDKSKELMKGNKFNFIKLLLSFVPYLLFIIIILIILGQYLELSYLAPIVTIIQTIIKPHITISKLIFTEELGNNK